MSPFQEFVEALSEREVEELMHGKAGIGCDSDNYRLTQKGLQPFDREVPLEKVKVLLREREQEFMKSLYSRQPLCRSEFDYQARMLIREKGKALFCRNSGMQGNWALMIDGWRLVAVGPDDVRSQYGYYCESNKSLDEVELIEEVMAWLKSGQAYEDYRSKTHCSYCQ